MPFPFPDDLPDPGIEPTSLALAGILYRRATNVYRSFICINPTLGGAKTYTCPLTAEWVNQLWYILLNRIELSSIEDDRGDLDGMEWNSAYRTEYHSALKMNELLIHTTAWMILRGKNTATKQVHGTQG